VAKAQLGAVRRYEHDAVKSVARTLAVSRDDAAFFETLAPNRVDVVPNGVDTKAIAPLARVPSTRNLLFLGSFEYSANVDAALFLIGEVLPLLRTPDAHLLIVGGNPSRRLYAAATRSAIPSTVTGYVADLGSIFATSRVFVAPIRTGGGTRIKILEALARGLPVITTAIGSAGLDLIHGRHAIIADDPSEFASWIDRLIEDDELSERLARAGRGLVEARYDWAAVGVQLDAALGAVARKSIA
jgi:glycosyltransferase involved in cell wall biosynthesis